VAAALWLALLAWRHTRRSVSCEPGTAASSGITAAAGTETSGIREAQAVDDSSRRSRTKLYLSESVRRPRSPHICAGPPELQATAAEGGDPHITAVETAWYTAARFATTLAD